MLFLGNAFYSGRYSADPTVVNIKDITYLKLSNGVFDSLFISSNPDYDLSEKKWGFDTLFYAQFQENLFAGNVMESLDDITGALIKRRKKGEFAWIPLFYIPIQSADDLKFERFDRYCANDTEYEYTITFLLNDIEGSYNINSIIPQFEGIFVLDKDHIFFSQIEAYIPQTERNHPVGVIPTIAKKYPFTVSHSENNYDSGSVTGVFMKINEACDFDFKESQKYQKELMEWLANGKAKFLKDDDGSVWMIFVSSNPTKVKERDINKYTIAFNWVEIADANDTIALLNEDFIDIPVNLLGGII